MKLGRNHLKRQLWASLRLPRAQAKEHTTIRTYTHFRADRLADRLAGEKVTYMASSKTNDMQYSFPACDLLKEHYKALIAPFANAFVDYEGQCLFNDLSDTVDIIEEEFCTFTGSLKTDETYNYETADFHSENKIRISGAYLQLLWCIIYATIKIYDEGYKTPLVEGNFTGRIHNFEEFTKLVAIFDEGTSLARETPLPSQNATTTILHDDFSNEHISHTAMVFAAAFSFVILHELGHNYFYHLQHNSGKNDEYVADRYALDFIEQLPEKHRETYKMGMLFTVLSFLFFPEGMIGGPDHPDTDDRIQKLLLELNLPKRADLYCICGMFYNLWLFKEKYQGIDGVIETCEDWYLKARTEVYYAKVDKGYAV